ncbi:hypothetical protein J2Z60_001284 [Lactobacillus colini]|uniref:Glycosyltransferase n=1 Tax=Lactobacillus colini TaxID=1819254 RepID=A0ABS4MEI6_9LACO|nr:Stealth CR1 domain-containing protein [Lactobacillus colini]MBP2058107.1 hypothetical protein [Lactobacillus colini]
MSKEIDFVITWVNDKDKNWNKKRAQYMPDYDNAYEDGASSERFRDYGTLLFLFRSIEKYSPWVHKIYLITDNQTPEWLNTNDKVKIIDHTKIIDKKYLPIFNSSVIEMNMYKIPNLSEYFVYFNDDMILNKELQPTDFFKDELPRDSRIYTGIVPKEDFDHILLANGILLNKYIDHKWPISKRGIFNLKNGINLLRTILFLPQLLKSGIPGYVEPHGPLSLRKSSFYKAKEIWGDKIEKNNTHRFRELDDITVWLIRHLQLELGEFYPRSAKFNSFYTLDQVDNIVKDLTKKVSSTMCINDKNIENYDEKIVVIKDALYKKFPEKSKFEL